MVKFLARESHQYLLLVKLGQTARSYIIVFVAGHEEICHVDWQDVGEKLFIVSLEVLHLLLLLCKYFIKFLSGGFCSHTCCLQFPQEVKSVGGLCLVAVDDEGDGEGDHDGNHHKPGLQVIMGTIPRHII